MADCLIDTHTFLWFTYDGPELSATAKSLIEDESNDIFLSMASLWEIAIKVSRRRQALRWRGLQAKSGLKCSWI
jgi:PIN domain nuclease of toxin-antitoxin system